MSSHTKPPGFSTLASMLSSPPKQVAQIAAIALLIVGCLFVLQSFLAALLLALVIVISSWPAYEWLQHRLHYRSNLSALLMTLGLTLLVLVPMTVLAFSLADVVVMVADWIRPRLNGKIGEAPDWLVDLPWIGEYLRDYWHRLAASKKELVKAIEGLYEPARNFAFQGIKLVGQGVLQFIMVLFIAFFFYRDGPLLTRMLKIGVHKLGGDLGDDMLVLARNTMTGVTVGIVGTAFGQALVMLIGLWIAGVPSAELLAGATFFLSMVPVGPPLIWGGAAFWLYSEGEVGWTIFMVLYGLLAVSSVDNFVKPMLISRTASLPLLLIVLGVFGGIFAFGFIGMFFGPALLAVAHALMLRWTEQRI